MKQETYRNKRLIIHDLEPEEFAKQFPGLGENDTVLSKDSGISQCIGCFGCWIKTPSVCVIKDEYQKLGGLVCQSDEVILISRCVYGGYSLFVKNVLDRSIACLLPFFSIRNGEVHHTPRTENRPRFTVHLYGDDITEAERETASKLVPANAVNLVARESSVLFYTHSSDIGREVI